MILSRSSIPSIRQGELQLPPQGISGFPEKILQFGTGVLLRGLPDYFVDKANRQGIFNGRIVIVKSTDGGDADSFSRQDGLYTICVRGIDNGSKAEENIISSSVSRVISAKSAWNDVMACASSQDLSIVISNTTEVGISYVEESINENPPSSFPGKLLAFLYERYKKLEGKTTAGLVIIPTELIVDNGKKLKGIVNDLAVFNKLEPSFIEWLNNANTFCSSLVDRIVPGKPSAAIKEEIQQQFGYEDELMIMAEVYRLWAIQGDEKVKDVLSFAGVDEGVVIEPDIDVFRELKLRMLNGTHTLSCGLAVLAGFTTVKDAMMDSDMSEFIAALMLDEIVSGIPYPIDAAAASAFGKKVLDRFRNPFIDHKWISITMQFSSKMKMRNVPVLLKYFDSHDSIPECISLGFAAYIVFMRAVRVEGANYFGEQNGSSYHIQDDFAAHLHQLWITHGDTGIVNAVLADNLLWGTDLSVLPGFSVSVNRYLQALLKNGGKETLKTFEQKKALI